jgi:hypothetical protein
VDWFRNDCRRDGSGAQGCVRNDIHAQDRFRVCQQTVFIEQKKTQPPSGITKPHHLDACSGTQDFLPETRPATSRKENIENKNMTPNKK